MFYKDVLYTLLSDGYVDTWNKAQRKRISEAVYYINRKYHLGVYLKGYHGKYHLDNHEQVATHFMPAVYTNLNTQKQSIPTVEVKINKAKEIKEIDTIKEERRAQQLENIKNNVEQRASGLMVKLPIKSNGLMVKLPNKPKGFLQRLLDFISTK